MKFSLTIGMSGAIAGLVIAGVSCLLPNGEPEAGAAETRRVIVQAADSATAAERVRAMGGVVTHELGIIDAVAAELTPAQRRALERQAAVRRIYDDGTVEARRSLPEWATEARTAAISATQCVIDIPVYLVRGVLNKSAP